MQVQCLLEKAGDGSRGLLGVNGWTQLREVVSGLCGQLRRWEAIDYRAVHYSY